MPAGVPAPCRHQPALAGARGAPTERCTCRRQTHSAVGLTVMLCPRAVRGHQRCLVTRRPLAHRAVASASQQLQRLHTLWGRRQDRNRRAGAPEVRWGVAAGRPNVPDSVAIASLWYRDAIGTLQGTPEPHPAAKPGSARCIAEHVRGRRCERAPLAHGERGQRPDVPMQYGDASMWSP